MKSLWTIHYLSQGRESEDCDEGGQRKCGGGGVREWGGRIVTQPKSSNPPTQ